MVLNIRQYGPSTAEIVKMVLFLFFLVLKELLKFSHKLPL